MARARKVSYCYVVTPSRAGEGSKILGALKKAAINLLAFSGFPLKGGESQIDLVAEDKDLAALRKIAGKHGWKLSKKKRGFLIQGKDQVGAMYPVVRKLAKARINIIAVDAVAAGGKRYGMIMWVKPADYRRAARALNAT